MEGESPTFMVLFTAPINFELRQVFTIKLETNTLFTPKATHSLTVLMILSTARSLLTSEFMMSLVPICKTVISVITSVSFKIGNVLMLHNQGSYNCS